MRGSVSSRTENRNWFVVDGFSSGNLYAPELRRRGFEVFHIQTSPEIPADFRASFHVGDYNENWIFTGDVGELVGKIRALNPIGILAGTETGVRLADELSEKLGLPSNGMALSSARRDKYLMIERLRSCGLAAASQFRTTSLKALLIWAERVARYPVVVKPIESAGTDKVVICRSEADVARAFGDILGKTNRLGISNTAVLAQSYLSGPEYVIDTVSSSGHHLVTDVWAYEKSITVGGSPIYHSARLIDPKDTSVLPLIQYFFRALDALGIQNGPAHGELIQTPDGPTLVEVGARCAGAGFPKLVRGCTGYSQVEATVDAAIDRVAFFRRLKQGIALKKNGQVVFLISERHGEVKRTLAESFFSKLSSFHSASMHLSKGEYLHSTADLFTSPGFIFLSHERGEVVDRDYRIIRKMEMAGTVRAHSGFVDRWIEWARWWLASFS